MSLFGSGTIWTPLNRHHKGSTAPNCQLNNKNGYEIVKTFEKKIKKYST
jgi:hypothetical protein